MIVHWTLGQSAVPYMNCTPESKLNLALPFPPGWDYWTRIDKFAGNDRILFPGRTNNHMLRLIMELKGKISHKLIKKSRYGEVHFDDTMVFKSIDRDVSYTAIFPLSISIHNCARWIQKERKTDSQKKNIELNPSPCPSLQSTEWPSPTIDVCFDNQRDEGGWDEITGTVCWFIGQDVGHR